MASRARARTAGHYAVKFGVLICILGFLGFLSTFSSSFRPAKFNGARRTILDDDPAKLKTHVLMFRLTARLMALSHILSCIIAQALKLGCSTNWAANAAILQSGCGGWFRAAVFISHPLLQVLWLLVLFFLLGTSADGYFCKSLDVIADGLKMSPEVAGLTILALGNGAPDVSSTIVAALGQQFNLGIGELLGAGLFVASCVVAAVSFAAPNAKLDRHSFLRDVSFYLVAVVAVFFICWDGHIYIYESIGFLVYYTGYVLFAVLVHYCGKKKETDLNTNSVSIQETEPLITAATGGPSLGQSMQRFIDLDDEIFPKGPEAMSHPVMATDLIDDDEDEDDDTPWTCARWLEKWSERSLGMKIFYILTFLPRLPLTFTVPTIRWNRYMNSLILITAPAMCMLALNQITLTIPMGTAEFPVAVIASACGIPLALLVFFTSSFKDKPIYWPVYVFLTFGLSIVWIYMAANELVNLLEAIGLVMHLSETILGATVLAWGNSIGDMVADVVMSRAGYPGMAIAATYGGPLFNLLIGLGVAMTITTIKTLPNPFHVEIDNLFFVTGAFLFFCLWTSLIIISIRRWRLHWAIGVYLLAIYAAFSVVSVLIETGTILQQPIASN